MDAVKNTVDSATDAVKGATAGTSKEANKNVAQDSNASAGTRASAAKDAVSDKSEELKHKS